MMADIFVSPDMFEIPEISLKLQKDMCRILLYKRQIEVIYEDESIYVKYKSKNTKVCILLNKLHPFVVPRITIDDISYDDWMINNSQRVYSMLHRLNFASPCCNSLLNHWTPLIQINSIFVEIENNIELIYILNGIYTVIEDCMHETRYNKDYIWIAYNLLQYLI